MKKVPDLINDLTKLWIEWIRLNGITTDESKSFRVRKKSADMQEYLTKERYSIINQINEYFERTIDERSRRANKISKR